jgi:hypothetical protein
LAFLSWIGADDHYDDTNLVVDKYGVDLRVAAIDFEHAFRWEHGEDAVPQHAPPALVANADPRLVAERLAVIESVNAKEIGDCSALSGHPDQERIAEVLRRSQGLLHQPFRVYGWLP